jgi:hypothetical protein
MSGRRVIMGFLWFGRKNKGLNVKKGKQGFQKADKYAVSPPEGQVFTPGSTRPPYETPNPVEPPAYQQLTGKEIHEIVERLIASPAVEEAWQQTRTDYGDPEKSEMDSTVERLIASPAVEEAWQQSRTNFDEPKKTE